VKAHPLFQVIARSALALGLCSVAPAHLSWAERPLPAVLQQVGIDQRIGTALPQNLSFLNEHGEIVTLGHYFGERPVVLTLVYYECPMLCTLVLNGLLRSLRALDFTPGKEFQVVTLSINPADTPAMALKKKQTYMEQLQRPEAEAGWAFLTGTEANIRAVADAVGFRYAYDETSKQFAHAGAIMVATPEGTLAQYFFGIEFSARDLRFALIQASHRRLGNLIDQALLYCFHYDASTGKYSLAISAIIRVLGLLTLVGLVGFIGTHLWREHKANARQRPTHLQKIG
jgi:protein SCO1/2